MQILGQFLRGGADFWLSILYDPCYWLFNPKYELLNTTATTNIYDQSLEFAKEMDAQDPLQSFRNEFYFPQHEGKDAIYFCGNSLGLQPKSTQHYIQRELEQWRTYGVEGHFRGEHPWFHYHKWSLFTALPRSILKSSWKPALSLPISMR